jgi:hypothetical protein
VCITIPLVSLQNPVTGQARLPYKSYDEPDHVVALLNCEHPNQTEFYCMKTKDILDGKGVAFRAYDCGIQATNLVPVIEKVKVKKPKQN